MKTVTCSSVAVSRGRRLEKRISAVGRAAGADHDHEAEHEQRVGEDRADDRGLGDDQLALLQGEDHDEQLGQVAERRLQHPRDGRAEVLAQLLGRERDDPGEPGQRERGQREARDRRPGAVVGRPASAVRAAITTSAERSSGVSADIAPSAARQWLSSTRSTSPYSSACSAVKKRSRSMSARTSSVGLPVCSA